jgi:hypothetical protein
MKFISQPRAALHDSRLHLGAAALAALALCLELWSVSSALATRGAEVCLTDHAAQRAPGRHCVADRLAGDSGRSEHLAQYLKGNCPGVPRTAIMASHRRAEPILEAAGPVCNGIGRG